MTNNDLNKKYKELRRKISRLYSGYTHIKEIDNLNRMLEIAYQNELKKILDK